MPLLHVVVVVLIMFDVVPELVIGRLDDDSIILLYSCDTLLGEPIGEEEGRDVMSLTRI